MSFIADLIFNLFRNVANILWFKNRAVKNSLNVFIKCSSGNTLLLDLDPKWDIKNVKEIVAPKLGTSPEEMKIIFAGKELQDSIVIEDCDLGQQSMLHVVKFRTEIIKSSPSSSNWKYNEIVGKSGGVVTSCPSNTNTRESKNICFYVYCNSVCKNLQIGKLRVRCSCCKSGAITVDSDPKSWSDVLNKQKISGHCEQDGCSDGAFGWVEFYFKCAAHVSQGEFDDVIPLPLIKTNIRDIPCLACTDIRSPVLVYPCNEGHVTCTDCFLTYARTRLCDRQFIFDSEVGYTLMCPVGCSNSLIKDCHYFKMLPDNLYETYQRFGTEEYVLNNGGVLCPQPGCGAGIISDPSCTKITCANGCGYVFCRNCLEGYHLGKCDSVEQSMSGNTKYALNPQQAAQARWDEASKVTIRINTKPCPKCRTATERDGGCMHIICTRCNFHWCWICQVEWTRDCMGSHWFG